MTNSGRQQAICDQVNAIVNLACGRLAPQKKQRLFPMHLEPSDKSGFTLVEIMIVLVIIGLMVGVAIPSFVKAREAVKLKAAPRQLNNTEAAKRQ